MASDTSLATTIRQTALTLAISAAGGGVAQLLHLPAPWLMGGALAVAIAALAGVRVMFPPLLRDAVFLGTGLSMGASVARDSLSLMAQWPVTLAALALELVLIIGVTGWLLRKFFGLDRGTAYLSSFPGHLSFVMAIAASGVGNSRQIVIIQVTRLLTLTVCIPVAAIFLPIGHYTGPPLAEPANLVTLGFVALVCLGVGLVFNRLRVPAAFALGAMAASTVLKLGGLFEGSMPPLLLTIIFIAVGGLIGSRFAGINRQEFARAAIGGFAGTFSTVAIVTLVALVAAQFVDIPFGQIWLGLSPGALEGMGALGIALGFDTAFIAAHHVTRLLALTFAIPFVTMLVKRRDARDG